MTANLPDTMLDGREWPRISIVTPSFNQARYVEEAIRSVLLQGYPNLEYIVMDGGSTDGSVEILRRYEPYLSHLRIGPDRGQAAAIGAGFRCATGALQAWINSDDRYERGAFARVARYFSTHPRVVFVNSDIYHINADNSWMERSYVVGPSWVVTSNLGVHNLLQQGCFWRSEAYGRCGEINEALRFCMDRDLFLRLMRVGPSRRMPGPPTASFRHHPLAKSSMMLDVADSEGAQLIAMYSLPALRWVPGLLKRYWGVRHKLASLREFIHRRWRYEF